MRCSWKRNINPEMPVWDEGGKMHNALEKLLSVPEIQRKRIRAERNQDGSGTIRFTAVIPHRLIEKESSVWKIAQAIAKQATAKRVDHDVTTTPKGNYLIKVWADGIKRSDFKHSREIIEDMLNAHAQDEKHPGRRIINVHEFLLHEPKPRKTHPREEEKSG
ncbi:MAG: hypothetical protein V1787_00855 [Candidatus Micrarchaeota archaeon]